MVVGWAERDRGWQRGVGFEDDGRAGGKDGQGGVSVDGTGERAGEGESPETRETRRKLSSLNAIRY